MQTQTKKNTLPMGLALGWLAAIGVTLAVAVAATALIAKERAGESAAATAAVAAMLFASFAGAMVASGRIGSRRLFVCLASGGIYLLTLICCHALLFQGKYVGLPGSALTILGSCLVAGLLGVRPKQPGNRHGNRRKRR